MESPGVFICWITGLLLLKVIESWVSARVIRNSRLYIGKGSLLFQWFPRWTVPLNWALGLWAVGEKRLKWRTQCEWSIVGNRAPSWRLVSFSWTVSADVGLTHFLRSICGLYVNCRLIINFKQATETEYKSILGWKLRGFSAFGFNKQTTKLNRDLIELGTFPEIPSPRMAYFGSELA